MNIVDLNIASDLDRSALAAVRGAGIVARSYLGSSNHYTNWSYQGEHAMAFLGNYYVHGKGWTKRFRTAKTWTRKQIFKKYFEVLVC